MKSKIKTTILALGLLLFAGVTEAKTVRATELNGTVWTDLQKGKFSDIIIEFRQGDELPVNLTAEGDLLETTQQAVSYVGVKRNFWLKVQGNQIQISLDGMTYKDFKDVLSGSIEAGAGSGQNGGVADAINVAFKAFLK